MLRAFYFLIQTIHRLVEVPWQRSIGPEGRIEIQPLMCSDVYILYMLIYTYIY